MGKNDPDPPQPVTIDPRETARVQAEFGKEAALFSKKLKESTWQETPYGTLRYEDVPASSASDRGKEALLMHSLTPGERLAREYLFPSAPGADEVPRTKMIQELHPADQALLDQQRALKGQYGDIAGQLVGKLGEFPTANEATRQQQLSSIMSRFQPSQARDRAALETQLANQGFVRGSQGWDSAMDEANRRETDFRLAANLQAGGEMRADLAQQMQAKNQALQGISTYMTGASPAAPQFAPISSQQVSAPDYAGLAATNAQMQNQANMAAYNAQMQNQGGGLGSLLGTAAGFAFGGPMGASIGGSLGGALEGGGGSGSFFPSGAGTSTFRGAMPGSAMPGSGWSF